MLNPFSIYIVSWLIVSILYILKWSDYYENLSIEFIGFIIITSLFSIIMSLFIKKGEIVHLTKKKFESPSIKWSLILITSGHFLQFFIRKELPLINLLINPEYSYNSFIGIKIIHILLVSYTGFYANYSIFLYFYFKKKKYLFSYIYCQLFFILLYYRGILTMNLIVLLFLIFYMKKISVKKYIMIFFIFIYTFGIIGNLRHGEKWNDSNSFIQMSKINDKFPKILSKQLTWGYIYTTSPLANLNKNIINNNYEYDIENYILLNLTPDFFSKKFNIEEKKSLLITKALNAGTMYLQSYRSFGILGMYITFFYFSLTTFILLQVIKKTVYYILALSIMNSLFALMIFSNLMVHSGFFLQIVYIIIFIIKDSIKKLDLKNLLTKDEK